jgi:alkylation response protein AidB-like acyl-CoA dehydrogenase
VSTRAESIGNGKYKINGTKIFISCGEHDMASNIIHCVLARLPGGGEGTRGISLFLVPKHKVSDDGEISKEFNGVNIGRIEVSDPFAFLLRQVIGRFCRIKWVAMVLPLARLISKMLRDT